MYISLSTQSGNFWIQPRTIIRNYRHESRWITHRGRQSYNYQRVAFKAKTLSFELVLKSWYFGAQVAVATHKLTLLWGDLQWLALAGTSMAWPSYQVWFILPNWVHSSFQLAINSASVYGLFSSLSSLCLLYLMKLYQLHRVCRIEWPYDYVWLKGKGHGRKRS
jgi:hypothetical protein